MFASSAARTVSLYHLPTTGGQTQGYPASADVTTTGHFLPMDRKDHLMAGVDLLEPHELYLQAGIDVRLQDKVAVGGDAANFYVRHVFKANFGGIPHQRVVVSRQVTAQPS